MNIDASQRGYMKMKIYLMDFSFCLVNFTLLKEPAEEKAPSTNGASKVSASAHVNLSRSDGENRFLLQ